MSAQIHLIASAVPAPTPHGLQGEADHRIANSLASISGLVRIAARHGTCKNPQRFLMEMADRIESVAALHRQVAQAPSGSVALRQFLTDICDRQRKAVTDNDLTLRIGFHNEREVAADMALSLGLITLELLSNSIKYAHPASTPLTVALKVEHGPTHLTYQYEDDGVGFPEGFDVTQSGNLGMRYLSILCQKLRASPQWESCELGVRFTLRIPV